VGQSSIETLNRVTLEIDFEFIRENFRPIVNSNSLRLVICIFHLLDKVDCCILGSLLEGNRDTHGNIIVDSTEKVLIVIASLRERTNRE